MKNKIEALYERIPKIACKKLCADHCGPIINLEAFSHAERPAIVAAVARARFRGFAANPQPLACQMLTEFERCAIYADRPAVCRLFGVVEQMRCPHGCEPERVLTDAEALALLDELEALCE